MQGAQHLFGVVEDVLLQGIAVLQEGFDQGLVFGFHFYRIYLFRGHFTRWNLSRTISPLHTYLQPLVIHFCLYGDL